jgi:vacuolar-type H+-ATPase subunit I/STV1
MKTIVAILLVIAGTVCARAQIPVTDFANLTNNTMNQVENMAKWVESIAQLKTQIDQLKQQVSIQGDIRQWTGDPGAAGAQLNLNALSVGNMVQQFGQTRATIISTVNSVASLDNTSQGIFRTINAANLDGQPVEHDPLTFRRYSVLDSQQDNYQQVVLDSKNREIELQEELATTLAAVKSASTDAEVRKYSVKIEALNGQLATVAAQRRDQADQVVAQKIANDARLEQERIAAAELEANDNYLANQRVSTYMGTLHVHQNQP